MSGIHFVSTDGATTSLQCYADNPDATEGQFITFVDLGDTWDHIAGKVAEHEAEHGCLEAAAAQDGDDEDGPYFDDGADL